MHKQSISIIFLSVLLVALVACTSADPVPSAPSVEPTTAVEAAANAPADDEAESASAFALAGVRTNGAGYRDLSVEQLADALPNKDFTLVNVHVPDQGSLPMTDLSIAFNDVDAFVAALPDKDAPIVIYCRSGGMSSQMAPALAALGYTNLFELAGGFNAWGAAGHELLPPR